MFKRLFIDHPSSLNETYLEHFSKAMSFALQLLSASLACFIHALIPAFCVKTGSKAITQLHNKMVIFRVKNTVNTSNEDEPEEVIEYMI